jgi:hypothetical protein
MTLEELLAELDALGVQLSVQGDRLRVQAVAGVLTDDLRQAIARCKPDLLARLSNPNEFNEMYELSTPAWSPTSLNSSNSSQKADGTLMADTTATVARWRAGLKHSLQKWDDEQLVALAGWHLVMAFDRGGATAFRRHLPRSLAQLTDADLAAIVDWPSLATLEASTWPSDPEIAARISRGAQKLAAWWNAQRAAREPGEG